MACPSTRVMMPNRAALIAAFTPEGILPVGLGTTVTCGLSAASCPAMASVRSRDGPTASTSSISPG